VSETGSILIEKLDIYAYHGFFSEEERLGQRFTLDLVLETDLRASAISDSLADTVNYGKVVGVVTEAFTGQALQSAGSSRARRGDGVLDGFPPVNRVEVTLRKPAPPIHATLASVGIKLDFRVTIEAALGLGGNLGDPVAAFAAALKALAAHPKIRLGKISSVYRTPPWGTLDQPEFLNMAALIETSLPAAELLALVLDIEKRQGRERLERWGPRTLDIDILSYGDVEIDQPGLQVASAPGRAAFALAPHGQSRASPSALDARVSPNRENALPPCFIAFSSRDPVFTSLGRKGIIPVACRAARRSS
jgi:2-amino-4-hydroxy-6-hydroxymethyldihydropteridine diphosphokinase/dihydroneopterin aldolase